jgi:site-specific recombinase XerC
VAQTRATVALTPCTGLPGEISPHWLRHAHASHALDRGAPISLVQKLHGRCTCRIDDEKVDDRYGMVSVSVLL